MSLPWKILSHGLRHPRRVAMHDDLRTTTYGEMAGAAMITAEMIDGATARPHVGILLPTSGAFPVALLGIWLSQRVAVPLNYLLNRDELRHIILDSGIDLVITVPAMLEHIGGAEVLPDGIRILDLAALDRDGPPPLRWPAFHARDEMAVILYTSGTSGLPKGAILSHGNLSSNVDAAIRHASITPEDTFLGVLPQFHSFGLTDLTLLPLRVGATAVYAARFVPRKVVELIRKHRPDIVMAVPSMYGALLSVKEAVAADFTSIRFAISGGEPLPDATAQAYLDRFGLQLLEGYGLTETSPCTNWATPDRNRPHSVGLPLPGVTNLVVDDHDRPVSPDTDGEIFVAGPNLMQGYYKMPEATAQVFVDLADPATGNRRRYFRTGDIGRIDRDGYLYVTGRKKEMLIIGGENVFPREIEEVLNRHDSVQDSAVIGKTDGMRGELPLAFVEIREGANFDEAALRSWCRDHLATYKVPREIRVMDTLPRTPTGKILRRMLSA